MKEGQGFARRVTLANLAKFSPLLRKKPIPTEATPGDQHQEKPSAESGSAYAEADKSFEGESLRTEPRSKRPVIKRGLRPAKAKPSTVPLENEVEMRGRIAALGLNGEQGFHYPQGVHVGHLLAILRGFGKTERRPPEFRTTYIRLHGDLGTDRISAYRRQLKYKLLAVMGFGLLAPTPSGDDVELTPKGEQLRNALRELLGSLNLRVQSGYGKIPSTRMVLRPKEYNQLTKDFLANHADARRFFLEISLEVPSVRQMLTYLQAGKRPTISKDAIYSHFFGTPMVKKYCQEQGIPTPTQSGAEHRLPFLLNILETCGFIQSEDGTVTILATLSRAE